MKIMIVVGARPNFMKAAPIVAAIRSAKNSAPVEYVLVHTGQHYDKAMSDQFFADLNMPKPDIFLGVGSASHAVQTAEIMKKFEDVLLQAKPDVLIVAGDVNSTVACALVAAKISFDASGTRPLIAHVEAGLRSFDRDMPEEINRILTDHMSDLLFVTEESGLANLRKEGISKGKIHFVGNTMIDSLLAYQEKAEESSILNTLGLRAAAAKDGGKPPIQRYALLTLHRPSNVDSKDGFQNILRSLEELAAECPIIFSAHPRTQKRIKDFGFESYFSQAASATQGLRSGILMTDPLGYLDFLCLMKHASVVVTDSGGIQEETTCLGVPCVTVRENTERPITAKCGTNVIAGTSVAGIRQAIQEQMVRTRKSSIPEKWDGKAADRIVEIIVAEVTKERLVPSRPV